MKRADRRVRLVLFKLSIEGKELLTMRMLAPDGKYANIETRLRLVFLAVAKLTIYDVALYLISTS